MNVKCDMCGVLATKFYYVPGRTTIIGPRNIDYYHARCEFHNIKFLENDLIQKEKYMEYMVVEVLES